MRPGDIRRTSFLRLASLRFIHCLRRIIAPDAPPRSRDSSVVTT